MSPPTSMEMYSLSLQPGGLDFPPPRTLLIEVLLSCVDLGYDAIVDKLLGAAIQTDLGVFKIERVKPQHFNEGGSQGVWINIRASL